MFLSNMDLHMRYWEAARWGSIATSTSASAARGLHGTREASLRDFTDLESLVFGDVSEMRLMSVVYGQ